MAKNRTNQEESGLTAAQERALVALLSSPTQEAAARQAGLTSRTLRRYLRTPEFRDEYRQRRRELMTGAVALAQQHAVMMVAVQVAIARDRDMPASVRVSAANNVYNIGDNGQRTEDFEERLARVEEQFDESRVKVSKNGRGSGYPVPR